MNIYNQIKSFYSIVFNSNFELRPTHISLYMFLLNQNNRNNWVKWFKCPFDLAMQGALINSRSTYYSALDDLVKFKLIKYKKGINTYKAPLISIIELTIPNNEQLNEQVTVPLSEQVSGTLSGTLSEHIIRLITDNYKLITDNEEEFEKFILNLSKPKKQKKDFVSHKCETLHQKIIKIHSDFYLEQITVPYKFSGGSDGAAAKDIINFLTKAVREKKHAEPTDQEIADSFQYIFANYDMWDNFYKSQLKLSQINSNLPNIIANIKNPISKKETNSSNISKVEKQILKEIAAEQALKNSENNNLPQIQ